MIFSCGLAYPISFFFPTGSGELVFLFHKVVLMQLVFFHTLPHLQMYLGDCTEEKCPTVRLLLVSELPEKICVFADC